ncbi:MAG: phosphotransferase, partial [Candidatus Limnocylindrales bacterium]|nr:phosphotransferase [Candidatus Limnocylindrales bacterium]
APDGLAWTGWATLPLDSLDPGELRETVPRWIRRRESGPTPTDPPWGRPGWFARASRWMVDRMAELGRPASEPPTLGYGWGISMILRAPTANGAMFLKCCSLLFRHEAALTAFLADATPDLVTRVAAIEPDEGWLLMHDHGDRVLGKAPPSGWATGLEAYARIQRTWSTRTDDLARAGAETRSLAALARDLPTFADREPLASEFTDAERGAWTAVLPGFIAACERLDRLGPAPTISHGDLHPWNVAATPDGPRIFDWSDTAIAHPFLYLAVYATRPKQVATRRALRGAYLTCWSDALSPAELAEAGDLAIVVGTLVQVESYIRILTGLDPDDRGGMEGAARSWARAAIETLRDAIALKRPGHADG